MSDPRRRAKELLGTGLHPHAQQPDGLPLLARRAHGARLEDTEGRTHLDWHMGFGAVLLGHGHAGVAAAIRAQLDDGTLYSVPHTLEVEIAERLVAAIPCAEKVAFGKNGSDVCTAAVRVARAVTGRDSILQYGYHGFHDWCAVLKPGVRGLPQALAPLVYPLPYNDLDAVRGILHDHGAQIAGVIMEPMRDELPDAGFLEGVRDAVHEAGGVLIFDEMVTGFRRGPGGAQTELGVTPDLACFGKALTNGLPLAALVGRADLIDVVQDVQYGMTTRGESLAFAAARAALDAFAEVDIASHVATIGTQLREGFDTSCARHGVDGRMVGHPSMQGVAFAGDDLAEAFVRGCREHGVFTNGHFLPSLAHDAAAVEETIQVFARVLGRLIPA